MTGETMKRFLFTAALLCAAAPAFGQAAPPKLYAPAAEVERLTAKAAAEHKGDNTNTVEVLARVGTYPLQLEYRTGATAPSVHTAQAEMIAVTEGGCTFVMGGTLVNPRPNGGNISGTSVTGGTSYTLAKGDTILVPAGTPHWVAAVQGGRFVSVTLHMPMTAQ
jgi:mannose-6-phosphate isomerase-like protein (cupin superfamily)